MPPTLGLGDQRGGGQVLDARSALHRVSVQAQHAFGSERGSTDDLGLKREPVAITAGDVHDGRDALFARESDGRQR